MQISAHARMLMDYMTRHKLNQTKVAKKLEVSAMTISKWFSGKAGITPRNRLKIEQLCGGSLSLSGREGDSAPDLATGRLDASGVLDALERKVLEADGICDACKVRFLTIIKQVAR